MKHQGLQWIKIGLGLAFSSISGSAAAQVFSPPVRLNPDSADANSHRIAAEADRVYVVWRDSSVGGDAIFLRRSLDAGATFAPALRVSADDGTGARDPRLAISGNAVYVVWSGGPSDAGEIVLSRSTDAGATFALPISISQSPTDAESPRIAAAGDTVTVAWTEIDRVATVNDLFVATSHDAGDSFDTVRVTHSGRAAPDQVLLADGNLLVAGLDYADNWNCARLRTSVDGGASFLITFNECPSIGFSGPPVALARDGSVYLTWRGFDPYVGFARSDDGGVSFGAIHRLSPLTPFTMDVPTVTTSGQTALVAWSDQPTGNQILLARSTDNGDTFDTPFVNVSEAVRFSREPRLVSVGERVLFVWSGDVSGNRDIFFRMSLDGGASLTGPPTAVIETPGSSAEPEIVLEGERSYLVWRDDTSGKNETLFSRASFMDQPPELRVLAVPRRIATQRGLVRIRVVVHAFDASGDRKHEPRVELRSISCSDSCNPDQDILGAAFGTDDREFWLRAERGTGPTSRAYTIEYRATSDSGSQSTAETRVSVVPH